MIRLTNNLGLLLFQSSCNFFIFFRQFCKFGILHLFSSLAPSIFELEKCYLHENWSDFNQKSIGMPGSETALVSLWVVWVTDEKHFCAYEYEKKTIPLGGGSVTGKLSLKKEKHGLKTMDFA